MASLSHCSTLSFLEQFYTLPQRHAVEALGVCGRFTELCGKMDATLAMARVRCLFSLHDRSTNPFFYSLDANFH